MSLNNKLLTVIIALAVAILIFFMIYKQVEEFSQQDDPMLDKLKTTIAPLFADGKTYTGILSRINERDVMKEISFFKGNKSYTINKHKVYLCLKNEHDEYYELNLLVYVVLHEIAHTLCESIGHTEEFHEIFELLLQEATKEGIFDNTKPIDPDYCTF